LVIDHVPRYFYGGGSPRAAELQRAIIAAGAKLTLLPGSDGGANAATAPNWLLRGGVVARGYGRAGIGKLLAERRGQFDVIIVSRPANMAAFRAAVANNADLLGRAAVIYDAEALFAEREAMQSRVLGPPLETGEAERRIHEEIELARGARIVLAVSEPIARMFRSAGIADVRVLGHALTPRAGSEAFAQRDSILFVGPTYADTSPNTDSVVWFVDHVLPLIRRGLGRDIPLELVGITRAPAIADRDDGRLRIRGALADLAPVYARSRVFVAPTRFASGLPLKVYDSAAHGVPVVMTPLLARQTGWRHEQDALVADSPAAFADACLRLYNDEPLWTHLRAGALGRVSQECDPDRFDRTVAEIVADAARPGPVGRQP
jgi:hypothetical protein